MRRQGRVVPNLVKESTSTSSKGPSTPGAMPRAGERMGGGSGGPNPGGGSGGPNPGEDYGFGVNWTKVVKMGLRGTGAAAGGAVITQGIADIIDRAGETHQIEYDVLKVYRANNPFYRDMCYNPLEDVLKTQTGEEVREKYGEQGCGVLLNKVKQDLLNERNPLEDWNYTDEYLAKAIDAKGKAWNLKESSIGESKVTREMRKVLQERENAKNAELAKLVKAAKK